MSLNLFTPDVGMAAPSTTTLASTGGLLVNIDNAIGTATNATSGMQVPIEDEKFGWFIYSTGTSVGTSTGQFVTGAGGTGSRVLRYSIAGLTNTGSTFCRCQKLSTTGGGTTATPDYLSKYAIPCKASTKYKITTRLNVTSFTTVGTSAGITLVTDEFNSAGTRVGASTGTGGSYTASTGGFIYNTIYITTTATSAYINLVLYMISGNGSVDWDINATTVEEVAEPVANAINSATPSLVSFTAVGSTDNIDQNLDPTFVAVNTYTPPVAISEAATDKQTFTPTKSKCARIGIYPVSKGTGNWTVTIHDASNVSQGAITIANASLTNGAVNYFNIPCNLTTGASYHFHVTSTVADGTVRVGTAADLETVSYIQNYYKPTTNFKASQNNSTVSISTNEEGFIEGSIINITTGAWSFTDPITDGAIQNNMYFERHVGTTFASNTVQFAGANRYYILKINTGLPMIGDLVYTIGFITNNTFTYSYDNVIYNSLGTLVGSGGSFNIPMTGYSTVYIKNNANAAGSMTNHSATGTVNLSSLSTLRNYPTNKDIIKQYSTTLGSPTTTATYRATKWGFPAIEYSATEYQFLDVDTTATGSTVAFSELGASYTTVADGASIAITSTSTPAIWVKHNITANRLYLSSNDYNASSDKDGSNKQSVVYQVKSMSTQSRNTKLSNRNASLKLTYG